MSDTLRDRVIAYARAVARNPGWLILPDHAERTIGAPWSEIRDALDALCAEPEPLFRRSRSLVLPNEDDWDANRVPVSDEDLAEAEETGRFYHPGTGEEIEGWRECLWVSYWTTGALRTAADEEAERRKEAREERLREAQWYLDYSPPVPPEIVFESLVRAVRAYMKSKEEE